MSRNDYKLTRKLERIARRTEALRQLNESIERNMTKGN